MSAVKGSDCVLFLDWEEGTLIRRIDVLPKNIYWNETGELVLIATDESFFVLKYNKVTHTHTKPSPSPPFLSLLCLSTYAQCLPPWLISCMCGCVS